MSKIQYLITSAVVLFLSGTWIIYSAPGTNSSGQIVPAPHAGFPAPTFVLDSLDGDVIDLKSLKGRAVVLNFWASWCSPCRVEMPSLQRVHEQYEGRDVLIMGVNTTYQDALTDVIEFNTEHDLSFPILLDELGDTSKLYQIQALPTTFFISPDGIIEEIVIGGSISEALLRTRIDHLLQEDR